MPITFIFSLIFSVLVVVFALQNSDVVTINFIFTEINISQALVILISAFCGAIIVLLLGTFRQIKTGLRIRKLNQTILSTEVEEKESKEKEDRKHIKELEKENKDLKKKKINL